jgi:hypothetical protein
VRICDICHDLSHNHQITTASTSTNTATPTGSDSSSSIHHQYPRQDKAANITTNIPTIQQNHHLTKKQAGTQETKSQIHILYHTLSICSFCCVIDKKGKLNYLFMRTHACISNFLKQNIVLVHILYMHSFYAVLVCITSLLHAYILTDSSEQGFK